MGNGNCPCCCGNGEQVIPIYYCWKDSTIVTTTLLLGGKTNKMPCFMTSPVPSCKRELNLWKKCIKQSITYYPGEDNVLTYSAPGIWISMAVTLLPTLIFTNKSATPGNVFGSHPWCSAWSFLRCTVVKTGWNQYQSQPHCLHLLAQESGPLWLDQNYNRTMTQLHI